VQHERRTLEVLFVTHDVWWRLLWQAWSRGHEKLVNKARQLIQSRRIVGALFSSVHAHVDLGVDPLAGVTHGDFNQTCFCSSVVVSSDMHVNNLAASKDIKVVCAISRTAEKTDMCLGRMCIRHCRFGA
jgi:hypothetical protein